MFFSPAEVQLERLQLRDSLSESDARVRVAAQLPIESKRSLATFVIDNSGDVPNTQKQTRLMYIEWLKIKKHWKIRLALALLAMVLGFSFYQIGWRVYTKWIAGKINLGIEDSGK